MLKVLALFLLSGCATGAQTWPQVIDGHIVISSCTICWALLCVGWLIRGPFKVNINAKQKDES